MMSRTMLATVILGLLALVIVGGAPPKYTDYDAFLKRPRPIVGGKPYVIEPPDTLRLLVPQVPELDSDTDRDKRVRPDGYVTFPLIGEVFAAGKTPTQLASEIEVRLRLYEMECPYIESPRVPLDRLVAQAKKRREQARTCHEENQTEDVQEVTGALSPAQ